MICGICHTQKYKNANNARNETTVVKVNVTMVVSMLSPRELFFLDVQEQSNLSVEERKLNLEGFRLRFLPPIA